MRRHGKLLLAAVAATAMLAATVSAASANRLSTSSQQIRVVWEALNMGANEISIECRVTLEGSFHSRTVAKVTNALIGFISRASMSPSETCRREGGAETATFLTATLPWHALYRSFTGTLPLITSVRIGLIGSAVLVRAAGVSCLYQSTATNPSGGIATLGAGGTVTGMRADETLTIPLTSGGFLCAETSQFSGTGRVSVLGSTTAISVRLI
jgi:outer membrane murein-binding lipoprotein Lpp